MASYERKRTYTCHICSRIFEEQSILQRHLRDHFGSSSNEGSNPQYLEKNDSNAPSSSRATQKATTSNKEHQLTALPQSQGSKKCHECPVCQKLFGKEYLKDHIKARHGDNPLLCPVCKRTFSKKSYLSTHVRSHAGDKSFLCHICGRLFISKSNLSAHLKLHEKPLKCGACGSTFPDEYHLRLHRERHAELEKPSKSTSVKEQMEAPVEEIHRCQICNKVFPHKYILKDHLQLHTGEKPFACEICNKRFPLKNYLRRHLKVHAPKKPAGCENCGKRKSGDKNLSDVCSCDDTPAVGAIAMLSVNDAMEDPGEGPSAESLLHEMSLLESMPDLSIIAQDLLDDFE